MNGWRRYLTRDSFVWWIGIAASVLGTLVAQRVCDPHTIANCASDPATLAYYGIPDNWAPQIRLAFLLVGIISAWMKTSPRPHSEEGDAKIPESGK